VPRVLYLCGRVAGKEVSAVGHGSTLRTARPGFSPLERLDSQEGVRRGAMRSGVQGGANVMEPSTVSTPGTFRTAAFTHAAITSWMGQPGAVRVSSR
jgi:hypothetical protein